MKAIDLSKYVIAYFDEVGDLITNKKLQKLLYYIEAWSLVHYNSIVAEEFEAWIHGPVVRDVYLEYKKFGYSPVSNDYPKSIDPKDFMQQYQKDNILSLDHYELIDDVLQKYGCLTSMQLEMLSHSETPWLEARGDTPIGERCSGTISKVSMKKYYSGLLENG